MALSMFDYKRKRALEPCEHVPSQIEPDGATSLKEVVRQFMSGVPVHTPQQYYFDFNGAVGIPSLDDLPQIPNFETMEQVHEFFAELRTPKPPAAPPEPPAPPSEPPAPPSEPPAPPSEPPAVL